MASQVIRKVVVSLLILGVLSGAGLCIALNQPKFIAAAAQYFFNKNLSNINIKELAIEKLKWNSWKDLTLDNVRVRCKINKDTYYFSVGRLRLNHLNGLLQDVYVDSQIEHLAIVSDRVNASDVNIEASSDFHAFHFRATEGSIQAAELNFDKYAFMPLRGQFKGTLSRLELSNIQSQFYQGRIQSFLNMDFKPEMTYETQTQLDQVDLEALASANPGTFEDMKGKVSGLIAIKATIKTIQSLKVDLKSPGGYISSSVLSALSEIIPKGNIIRQPLDRVLKNEKTVLFENSSIFMEMVEPNKYSAKVNLLSSKAFLDLRYTYDMNFDGGLSEFLILFKLLNLN